jgi:hypothetical protein
MKFINYLLIVSVAFSLNLFAASEKLVEKANYESSYEESIKKAQELNMPVMMVVGQKGCPYCSKFYNKTLTRKSIKNLVHKDFIPLSVLRFTDSFPKRFVTKGVPTVLFLDPKEEKVFYKSFGYKSKGEYKGELKKALEIFNSEYKNN